MGQPWPWAVTIRTPSAQVPRGARGALLAGASSLAAGGAVIGWQAGVKVEAEVAVDELAV